MPHWGCKKDANHPEIVKNLIQCGADVIEIHRVGGKAPDVIVGWQGTTVLLEIKGTPQNNAHEAAQEEGHKLWRGGPRCTVRSWSEAWDFVTKGIKPVVVPIVRRPRKSK